MARGKYEKKKPVTKGKYLRQPVKQIKSPVHHEEKKEQKHPVKYASNKRIRQKIYAIVSATALSLGAFHALDSTYYSSQSASVPSPTSSPAPEPTKPQIVYSIGIANDNAKIEVDGKSYEIDPNSFVIVSEEQALAYDVHGNMLKGEISAEDFKEVKQLSEEEMSKFNIRQVTSDIDVNVRSSGEILNDNIISTVPSYDYVLAYDAITPEVDDKEWLYTLSINNDSLYEGYIREDLIKEIDTFDAVNYRVEKFMENMENIMVVDTSKDNYISLNLRSEPKAIDPSNILTKIPYGSLVNVLDGKVTSSDRTWVQISYKTLDGNVFEGWVSEEYLSQDMVPEKPIETEVESTTSKYVTGIDISSMSPNTLRKLLQTGIPDQVSSDYGTFNTSQLAGDINFVYIKLGASPYQSTNFAPLEYDNYIEQVKICEEFGIPYGFYYYSTAINEEEAKMELNCIQERIENLREKYDLQNNKLEIAVDVELSNSKDRQYNGNIKEQTEAKATLINGIQELNLSNNVLIYGPSRVMKPDLDQIIDLSYLHTLLDNPDNVTLWQTSLINKNGTIKSSLEYDISYAEEQGFSTSVCQLLLDGTVIGKIDINSMDREHYETLLNQENLYDNTYNQEYER